jgi:hypothetical protein
MSGRRTRRVDQSEVYQYVVRGINEIRRRGGTTADGCHYWIRKTLFEKIVLGGTSIRNRHQESLNQYRIIALFELHKNYPYIYVGDAEWGGNRPTYSRRIIAEGELPFILLTRFEEASIRLQEHENENQDGAPLTTSFEINSPNVTASDMSTLVSVRLPVGAEGGNLLMLIPLFRSNCHMVC